MILGARDGSAAARRPCVFCSGQEYRAGRAGGGASRRHCALGAPTVDGLSQQGGELRGIKDLKQRQPLPSKVRVAAISRCNSAGSEEVECALIVSVAGGWSMKSNLPVCLRNLPQIIWKF